MPHEPDQPVRPLMLGKGWFPDEMGGLDRYFRSLLEHLPEAQGIVLGPAEGAPSRVEAPSAHDRPLAHRLAGFTRAARDAGKAADLVDGHFALYALLPILALRRLPLVVHFHGPWAAENQSRGDRSGVRAAVRRTLERAAYRRAALAITLTGAFRQVLVEDYGVSPWRIQVVPPGVDSDHFAPTARSGARRQLGLPEDAWVAVCVRRLVPRMGLDHLLTAW